MKELNVKLLNNIQVGILILTICIASKIFQELLKLVIYLNTFLLPIVVVGIIVIVGYFEMKRAKNENGLIIALKSLLAHFATVSVGREVVFIHLSKYLGKRLEKYLKISNIQTLSGQIGFSVFFGTPITALFFENSVLNQKQIKNLISCYSAVIISLYVFKNHFLYQETIFENKNYDLTTIFKIISIFIITLFVGLAILKIETNLMKITKISNPLKFSLICCLAVIMAIHPVVSNLGINDKFMKNIPQISDVKMVDVLLKIFVTLLATFLGFKGGIFTPMLAVGYGISLNLVQLFNLELTNNSLIIFIIALTFVFVVLNKKYLIKWLILDLTLINIILNGVKLL